MKSVIKSAKTVDEAVNLGLADLGLTRNNIEIEVLEEPKSGLLGIFGSKDAIVKITEKVEFKIDINDIYGEKTKTKETVKEVNLEPEVKETPVKTQEEVNITDEPVIETQPKHTKEIIEEKKVETKSEKTEEIKPIEVKEESKKVKPQEKTSNQEVSKTSSKEEILAAVKVNLEDLLESMHIKANVDAKIENDTLSYNLVDISEEDTGIIIGRKGETLDSLQYILSLMANKNSSAFNRVALNVANYRARRKDAIENNARKVAFRVIKSKKAIALEPMNSYERRIVHYALQNYKEVETVSQGNFPNRKVVIKYKD